MAMAPMRSRPCSPRTSTRRTGSRWLTAVCMSPTRTRWCDLITGEGQTRASGPPVKVTDLPSAINHHWTKALAASPDGRFLYVGIGSNSNITERGMEAEVDRAMVWQVDAADRRAQTLCYRPAQSHCARHPARNESVVGGGERARRARPEPCPRLPHFRPRKRILRLALQLLGAECGPARSATESGKGCRGDCSGLQPGIACCRARARLLHACDGRPSSRTACSSASMAVGIARTPSATR